jgi:hypothetical protein
MEPIDWKTWAAIWGAVTGTIALFMQIFSRRPRFAWAHGDENVNDDRVRLIIHNPAASQMMLAAFLWSRRGYECFPVRHDDSVGNTVRDVAALVEFPA